MHTLLSILGFTFTLFSKGHCLNNVSTYKSNCKVVGDPNAIKIYKDNVFPTFNTNIDNLLINGTKYSVGYCECSTETGNCRVEYDAQLENTYRKVIVEYIMLSDLKNKTFDSLYADYKKEVEEKRKQFYYYGEMEEKLIDPMPETHTIDPQTDKIYFSNSKIYHQLDGKIQNDEEVVSVESAENILKSDHNENKKDIVESYYPLRYAPALPLNEDEQISIIIGKFEIGHVVDCTAGDKDFKNGNVTKKAYTREGFQAPDVDCSWGNPSVKVEKILNAENENGFNGNTISSFVIFIISFALAFLYI
ncbi:hypothetical protein H8356DRAFT_1618981 [Neocallimastix lanati (nom. inval.)]|jgi:hypothetical protein|uniref:SH3 domain-containing protein n=1 Tax=Neocallimastix californiae TaxID=1754190 RepID=A0A1Y2D6I5_9FUNG|nr:hypothetical protein H8356DRAFT_1618981 [Neocallimastix sp. JGI-2020a]ORY54903.1 hypothetical protein LY90DRAFT_702157 [Neocallimastix californiae]|eukprot:ORY54903.1 hypothetical protein LY90DRAFT_702157 [Neocallimastix californiae]